MFPSTSLPAPHERQVYVCLYWCAGLFADKSFVNETHAFQFFSYGYFKNKRFFPNIVLAVQERYVIGVLSVGFYANKLFVI